MRTLVAVGRLTRVYTVIVAGVVVVAVSPAKDAVWAGVAMALMLAGAFAFNDVWDREADAVNVPSRPIPSGVLTARTAVAIAIACDAGALGAALYTRSSRVIALTAVSVAVLVLYSIRLKRILGVKNAVMALIGASVPLFGSFSGRAQQLAVVIGLFILQKEIVADVCDCDGDARVGLRTFPVVFGVRGAMGIVIAVNAAFLVSVAFLPPPARYALAVVGVANILVASTIMRDDGPRHMRRFLRLQQAFLFAGVFFAWM